MKFHFEEQTRLLLEVLRTITSNPFFVLKGGTAINFFHTNVPRLSVDIDLAYTKINSRTVFLKENNAFFDTLLSMLPINHAVLVQQQNTRDGIPKRLDIYSKDVQIKAEVNLILRGAVYSPTLKESCLAIKQKYDSVLTINTLSFEDLYAGKFCAALDRQHPRDLFDVMIFYENHQISERLKKAFLIYLISCNRPIAEMIDPHRLELSFLYEKEFIGMTNTSVSYKNLVDVRERLISDINAHLNEEDRKFLIAFKKGAPEWNHFDIEHVKYMPAIKWKLHNIAQMEPKKHQIALTNLTKKLGF